MYNNADKSEQTKFGKWKQSAKLLIDGLGNDIQPFSIGVVPDELRKWNENAYIPKVVSIGPRYKGATRGLQQMEEIKWGCLKHLFLRTPKDRQWMILLDLERLLDFDVEVRASYVDEIKLDRYELGTIMLNDGCFLLELLISGSKELNEILKSSNEVSEDAVVLRLEESLTDLILLENQIPLIILKKLTESIFPRVFIRSEVAIDTIQKLVRSFLGLSLDSSFDTNLNDHAALFLELVYVSIFENSQVQNNQESYHSDNVVATKLTIDEEPRDVNVKLNRCATMLQAAGVIVTCKTGDSDNKPSDVDSKFNPLTSLNFEIEFNNGKLQIPRLHITERTEERWLNFIAREHHKMKGKSFINKNGPKKPFSTYKCKCTMAALLFNGLTCCASDVQLLKDKKVIVDHSNMSNQDLVDLFSSIPNRVDPTIIRSGYAKMFYDLNTYSATPYVISIPIMLWHYLAWIPQVIYSISRFLRKGYNFAAAIISIFTVIQTVYAILSYHDSKN